MRATRLIIFMYKYHIYIREYQIITLCQLISIIIKSTKFVLDTLPLFLGCNMPTPKENTVY